MIRFGYLGRMHEEKGVRELLAALRLLEGEGLRVPFLFAGEGPMEEEVRGKKSGDRSQKEEVRGQGAEGGEGREGIRWERVESPETSLRKMDVMVLPSRSEAMPLAIVEALMCGRPVIATAVGGIPDLVRDGVEGMLLADNRPETIGAAIRRFAVMGEEEFEGYRCRARARYEECCTPERVGAVVEGHYRAILNQSNAGAMRPRGGVMFA